MAERFLSTKRLYLTNDNRVVEEGNPDAERLLVGIGGTLSLEEARRYGLLDEPEAEKAKPAPANKARTPRENK